MTHITENIISNIGHWRSEDDLGEELGIGTCWPITEDIVVTNFHVAVLGPKATISFKDSFRFPAVGLVAYDKPRDLALIKLRVGNKKLTPLLLCEDMPKSGSEIFVFGNPFGLTNTITKGIISSIRKTQELKELGFSDGRHDDILIQIDAAINPGNSGGPIINDKGHVIGITSFRLSKGQSLNFGIPSSYVAELLDLQETPRRLSEFYVIKEEKKARKQAHKPKVEETDTEEDNSVVHEMLFQPIINMLIAVATADDEMHDNEIKFLSYYAATVSNTFDISIEKIKEMTEKAVVHIGIHGKEDTVLMSANALKKIADADTRGKIFEHLKNLSEIDGEVSGDEEELLEMIEGIWDDI